MANESRFNKVPQQIEVVRESSECDMYAATAECYVFFFLL